MAMRRMAGVMRGGGADGRSVVGGVIQRRKKRQEREAMREANGGRLSRRIFQQKHDANDR